jgi:hypothetical protein
MAAMQMVLDCFGREIDGALDGCNRRFKPLALAFGG